MPESPISEPALLSELISIKDDYVHFELDLECSFSQVVEYIDAAIRYTRQEGKKRLFVDARNVRGFPKPTLIERYHMVEAWSAASGGAVKMVIVAPVELTDPEKIGVTMARNRGFIAEAFHNEADAFAWLLNSSS